MATRKKHPETPPARALTVRFEADLATTPYAKAVAAAAALDLDRLPDANGKVKLLLTADDIRRLLERGFEVHLTTAVPVAPLEQSLVMSDDDATKRLEQEVKSIRRKGGR